MSLELNAAIGERGFDLSMRVSVGQVNRDVGDRRAAAT